VNTLQHRVNGELVEYVIDGISQQALPSLTAQAVNAVSAVRTAISNPVPISPEERERRLSICHACEFLIDGKRCMKCGCHVNWKSRLEAWHCPIEKW